MINQITAFFLLQHSYQILINISFGEKPGLRVANIETPSRSVKEKYGLFSVALRFVGY